MNTNEHIEKIINANFDTKKVTDYLTKINSPLNYGECYSLVMNYCEQKLSSEQFQEIKNNINKEKIQRKQLAKKIYEQIKEGKAIKELSEHYNKRLNEIVELYYQYLWQKTKGDTKIMDITEKQEYILSKYLFYIFTNNNKDESVYYYKDIIEENGTPEEINNFLKEVLNNYINNEDASYKITEKELNILQKLNYYPKKEHKKTLEEIKTKYQKDEQKHIISITNKVEELLNSDESVYVPKEYIKDYIRYSNKEKIQLLQNFIEQKKKENKIFKYDTTMKTSKKGYVFEHIVQATEEMNEKEMKRTYIQRKLIETPQVLATIKEEEQINFLNELEEEDLIKIEKQINKDKLNYILLNIKRAYKRVITNKKIEGNSNYGFKNNIVRINNLSIEYEEMTNEQKAFYQEALTTALKAIYCITKDESKLTKEIYEYIKEEDFSLLDYLSMTNLEITDVYNIAYHSFINNQNIITEEEIDALNYWINSKVGSNIHKKSGRIIFKEMSLVTEKEIKEDTNSIKGIKLTKEQQEFVANYLTKNGITLYSKAYKNALKRYIEKNLTERVESFQINSILKGKNIKIKKMQTK